MAEVQKQVRLPDGRTATLSVDEGTSDADILSFAEEQFAAGAFDKFSPEGTTEETPEPKTDQQGIQRITAGVPFMTDDGPAVLDGGQIKPITQEQADLMTGKTKTAGQIGQEFTFPRSGSSVVDFAGDVLTAPIKGAATLIAGMAGAPTTGRDLAEATLDAVVPLAGGISGVTKVSKVVAKLSSSELKKTTNTKDLLQRGSSLIENYKKTGDAVSGDDLSIFWVHVDDVLKRAGIDAETDPNVTARMNSIARRAEKETLEPMEMLSIRRGIKSTIEDVKSSPEEKRLATILLDEFDQFALTLPGGKGWQKGRREYAKGKKSEQIQDVLLDAELGASGLENGIRIELRKILKSKKKSLGFSSEEKQLMRQIVKGDFTSNTLKRLSKMAFGSGQQTNVLGGLGSIGIGGGAGAAIGGPVGSAVGAAAAPIVGGIAAKKLERNAVNALGVMRAVAAGRNIPEKFIFKDTGILDRLLTGAAASAASNIPEDETTGAR